MLVEGSPDVIVLMTQYPQAIDMTICDSFLHIFIIYNFLSINASPISINDKTFNASGVNMGAR